MTPPRGVFVLRRPLLPPHPSHATSRRYEEIIKLKNLVAEKMKVIAVLEKERQSMQKLHRQYQKDAMDQDAMEAEYASRVQRVNGPAPACPSLPPRPRPCCCPRAGADGARAPVGEQRSCGWRARG